MTALEAIVKELKSLPPEKFERAAEYVHELRESSMVDRRAILRATSGRLSGEAGESLANAIEEGCERIDERDW